MSSTQNTSAPRNAERKTLPLPAGLGESQMASASTGRLMRQLFPLVSTKSWRVMASGSRWCSRKGRSNAGPTTGRSGDPQVSAAQCTTPDTRSAAR